MRSIKGRLNADKGFDDHDQSQYILPVMPDTICVIVVCSGEGIWTQK